MRFSLTMSHDSAGEYILSYSNVVVAICLIFDDIVCDFVEVSNLFIIWYSVGWSVCGSCRGYIGLRLCCFDE